MNTSCVADTPPAPPCEGGEKFVARPAIRVTGRYFVSQGRLARPTCFLLRVAGRSHTVTEFFNRPSDKKLRSELRSTMPASEVRLWACLKGKQLTNCKFRRQYGVGQFAIDFYAPEIKLGIEIDGDSHFEPGAQISDSQREAFLVSAGIRVMRFQNADIWENLDWVLEEVAREIERLRTP